MVFFGLIASASLRRPKARPTKYCAESLTMTVSISRSSWAEPAFSRIATIAPIGRPKYRQGSSVAEAEATASFPPRHDPSESAPTATNAVIRIRSSGIHALPPNAARANDAQVSMAAAVATTAGNGRSLARARPEYSWHASPTSATAMSRNSQAGEYHTAATVSTMSTAPLRIRVITWRPGRPATP